MSQWGGGVYTRLAVGQTSTWASLVFPTELSSIPCKSWSMVAGVEMVQRKKEGDPAAEFPPQLRGVGIPAKKGVAGWGTQINVTDVGGGEEGCCPVHHLLESHGLLVVCGLLHKPK